MTAPLDPALACALAHEARRHRPLPPLDDLLPLAEDDPLPLDWRAPIAGPRWYDVPMLASAAVGWAGIVIAVVCALLALP